MRLSIEDATLKRYEKYLTPDDSKKLGSIRTLLVNAGYRNPSAVRVFYAVRILLSVSAVLISITLLPTLMTESPIYLSVSFMVLLIMMGFYFPSFWLRRTSEYRRQDIQYGFPDCLDLLLVCIEAGHGFDQALTRVVDEMGTSNAVVADELQVVIRELRAGKDRYQVLSDFADRTGSDDISSFITVIKQADKYGVSIADALRVYSTEMRDKRYMKAEEKANIMPVKLALGAIMFTVPPAIIVMVGPSIIMLIRQLGDVM